MNGAIRDSFPITPATIACLAALALATPAGAGSADGESSAASWRIDATAYAWFQGVSGDVTALGHKVNIDASPSDLLSYANFPAQGVVNVLHGRLVAIADASWTPLTVNTAHPSLLPLPPGMAVEVQYSPVIATAEAGYRVANPRGYAVDALAGARYWYLGATLTLTPSPTGSSVSKSTDWFDPLVGARVQKALLPRLEGTLLGDVGGFGVGANLDYQVVAALGLTLAPRWSVDAAWRQIYADYETAQLHSKTTESGLVAGVTFKIH